MFRHEKFYTFEQVGNMVHQKFEYIVYGQLFSGPDTESNQIRRSAWIDWQTALVFQRLDEVFLFSPRGQPISIDAGLICRTDCSDALDEYELKQTEKVIEFHARILLGFPLVDFDLGILKIPDERTDRIAAALREFDGYTIGMPVDEVVASLLLFQEWIDAAEGKPAIRTKGGRPPLALKAANAYIARYPEGHEAAGKKWRDVEQELNVVAQTIKTGLAMLHEKPPI